MQNEKQILSQLIGLEVNRTWISIGSWLWIELGELMPGGDNYSLFGDFTLEIACGWRLSHYDGETEEILIHSESISLNEIDVFSVLKGKKLLSFELNLDQNINPFASIEFSNDIYLFIWFDNELEFSVHSREKTGLLEYKKTNISNIIEE